MPDLDTIQACEERLVNVWPAMQTLLMGDWVLRFAHGYSGRANSASAIRPGADLDADTIEHLVRLYREAGLAPAVRVSPLCVPTLANRLTGLGWSDVVTSIGMIATTGDWRAHHAVETVPCPDKNWIDGVTLWQEERKRNAAHFAAILGQIRLPACFATLHSNGHIAGYGMSVCDRDMAEIGSIMIGPTFRGAGLGRVLVESLLSWANGLGARRVFLQVDQTNARAINLYRSLGFVEVYRYTEYRLQE